MSVTASFSVSQKERAIQEALEARLDASEVLESYTQCRYNPGGLTEKIYWLGLTRRRLMILRKDLPLRVYSIYRPFIQAIHFSEPSWRERGGLALQVGGGSAERVDLSVEQGFCKRTAQFARSFTGLAPVTLSLTASDVIGQVVDFYELGMLRAARFLLRERQTADPLVEIDPRGVELDRLIHNAGAARVTAASMNILALLVLVAMIVLGFGAPGVGLVLSLMAIFELVRRQYHRGVALGLGLAAAGTHLVANLTSAGLLAVVMWLSLGVALALTLAGHPSRKRMAASAAVFVLGFFGALALIIAAAGMGKGLGTRMLPQARDASASMMGSFAYTDDFSSNQGWPQHDEHDLYTQVEDGRYTVHLKEDNATFFAFPPLDFSPEMGSVDIVVPADFRSAQGTFGMVCGFHPTAATATAATATAASATAASAAKANASGVENSFYRIEIDPGQRRYAVLRQTGADENVLTDDNWRPLTGLGHNPAINNLTVSCSGGQINVKVNAVEQARIWLGAGETFAQGKMGLFVSTWEDTGPQGYEILFDNARFNAMGD